MGVKEGIKGMSYSGFPLFEGDKSRPDTGQELQPLHGIAGVAGIAGGLTGQQHSCIGDTPFIAYQPEVAGFKNGVFVYF